MTHRERLRDQSGFIHRSGIGRFVGGVASSLIGSVPLVGGIASSIFDRVRGEGVVPGTQAGCPPGFFASPSGCVPRAAVDPRLAGPVTSGGGFVGTARRRASRARDFIVQQSVAGRLNGPGPSVVGPPLELFPGVSAVSMNGVPRPEIPTLAVTGQFGAGFEASIISREMRLCPPKTVLGVDGVCYNRRDLRNDERAWPRGRRPLLTGGEVRAISTASAAAKKLQRKQKQLQELGLLPKPQRARRALLPGHRATLTHSGAGSEH